MRCQKARRALATLLLVPAVSVFAEEPPVLRVALEEPRPAEKNRFGLSYRMSFNITAQFRNVGSVARTPGGRGPGPATGGAVDRNYDDGYNRVDSSGNDDGLTWNWGYRNDSQVVGDTLVMRSRSAQAIDSETWDNDPQHGFELTYNRELGILERTGWHWGVEGAFGWTDIDIKDRRPLAGGVREIADAYDLGGIDPSRNQIPPGADTPAPYTEGEQQFNPGTPQGPGPLLDSTPNRTVTFARNGALVTGSRRFDAHFWTYRLGPYLDIPIDDRWTFTFSAGAIVGVVEGEFTFRQAVRTGGATRFQSGSGSNTDVVWGGYLSALFRYAIDENWGVFVGGQYLGLTCYEAEERGQKVEIDFARTANATMGVSFSF